MVTSTFFRVECRAPGAEELLTWALYDALTARCNPRTHIPVFALVGTPELMGDSVGPRVGDLLRAMCYHGPFVGDSQNPLDAKTLHTLQDRALFAAAPWH